MTEAISAGLADELATLAAIVAAEAGELAVAMATQARVTPSTKSSTSDFVTDADRAAEAHITHRLGEARPDDGILGEEGAATLGTSRITWHVDPIDGTTNFVYDIPAFSVSIAAALDDEVIAGAVLNPTTGELYRAVLGQGATRNGSPLTCRSPSELSATLVATGFGYLPERRRSQGHVVAELLPRIRDIRRFGSAALDLCAVASGQVDAYYERGLNRWDLAAGALIASESGATVANLHGGPPGPDFVLAAGPSVFDDLRAALVDLGADLGP